MNHFYTLVLDGMIIHTLTNPQLTAHISSSGAELRSLKYRETGREYIWPMNPSIWGNSSPILFPAVGSVREGIIIHNQKDYPLPKHGILRNNPNFQVERIADDHLIFRLSASEQTMLLYPFDFHFEVHYRLQERSLMMEFKIENRGGQTLYFNLGGHTAYYCPLQDFSLEDYGLDIPTQKPLVAETIDPESKLLGYQQRTIALDDGVLRLSADTFKQDALIFDSVDFDWVRLRKLKEQKGLKVYFEGFPHLALWAKPGADYVCIEPWLGLPDRVDAPLEISQKTNYQSLAAGESYRASIVSEIEATDFCGHKIF